MSLSLLVGYGSLVVGATAVLFTVNAVLSWTGKYREILSWLRTSMAVIVWMLALWTFQVAILLAKAGF